MAGMATFPDSWRLVVLSCAVADLPLAERCAALWLGSRAPDELQIRRGCGAGGEVLAKRDGCAASAPFMDDGATLDSAACAVVDALASRAGEVVTDEVWRRLTRETIQPFLRPEPR